MSEPTVLDEKEKLDKLFSLIPADGKPKGNISLLQESGFTENEYWLLRNQLIEQGKIAKGRGKGGSVYRLEVDKTPSSLIAKNRPGRTSTENEIYADFENWLKSFWVKDHNLTWYLIEKTANQGRKPTGGKWTRPDFAIVAINTYRYLPGKFLEVVSFEVKPSLDEALAGVFECAAHSVYATRSYLAVYLRDESDLESEDYERIETECKRFDLGLIVFSDPKKKESYDERVEAVRRTPDPNEQDKFIASQLKVLTQEALLKQIK